MDDTHKKRAGLQFSSVFVLATAFAVGIGLGTQWPWGLRGLILGVGGGALALVFALRGRRRAAAGLLIVAAVGAGGFHSAAHHRRLESADVFPSIPSEGILVRVRGVVEGFPKTYPPTFPAQGPRTSATLSVREVQTDSSWRRVRTKMQLSARLGRQTLRRGDLVEVAGRLRPIGEPRNPGGFDFRQYYARRGVFTRLYVKDPRHLNVTGKSLRNPFSAFATLVRRRAAYVMRETAGDSTTAGLGVNLLLCLVCGDSKAIDADVREVLSRAGVYHFFVVSGLHVGLVAGALIAILRLARAREPVQVIVLGVGVLAYVAITGFNPPAVRALVMLFAWLGRMLLARRGSAWDALALAAFVLLLVNPNQLFSSGFQLSFAAVAFILLLTGRFSRAIFTFFDDLFPATETFDEYRRRYWVQKRLARLLAVSAAAWLGVWILIARGFHIVTPTAILSNLLFVPLVFVALVVGIIFLLFALIAPPLAAIPAAVATTVLALTYRLARGIASLEGLRFQVGDIPWWVVAGYFAAVAAFLAARFLSPGARRVTRAVVTVAFLSAFFITQSPRREPSVNVLDVGHGLCVAVLTEGGKTIVYDCGSSAGGSFAGTQLAEFLRDRRRPRIDLLVLSHPDSDHCSGVPYLLDRFPVSLAQLGPGFREGHPVVRALDEYAVPRHFVRGSAVQRVGALTVELGAPKETLDLADNDTSLWMRLAVSDTLFLITGDQEKEGIQWFLSSNPPPVDVLVLPHHGHDDPALEGLLAVVAPRLAIASTRSANAKTQAMLSPGDIAYATTSERGCVSITDRPPASANAASR